MPSGVNVGIGIANPSTPLQVLTGPMVVGDYPYTNTNATAGTSTWRFTDGSLYQDFKTFSGGRIYFRSGAGTETGYTRSWMTVDPSTAHVGLGTNSPTQILSVAGQGVFLSNPQIDDTGDGSGSALRIGYTTSGDYGYILANNTGVVAKNLVLQRDGGNVGVGTSTPQFPLSVNGTIQAKEVLVNTGWSDYVFDSGYHLAPLSEVSAYVTENHHLPGIPSAAEVAEKGISLGEMQSKLLAKIEELTLHMIQTAQENLVLRDQNREIQGRLTRLEDRGVGAK